VRKSSSLHDVNSNVYDEENNKKSHVSKWLDSNHAWPYVASKPHGKSREKEFYLTCYETR